MSPKIILFLLLSITSLTITAETNQVHEFNLKNGLRLLVQEDHRAPIVVSQVWYKVGSSYEHNGITGVSHVLEHMMFKGTEKLPAGEFSRIISKNGGRENAFTGQDYTAYFQQLEKSRLKVSFELEADRMKGLLLDEEEFKKELQVVIEERRLRTEDKPKSLTYEQFQATAFVNSPYHHPVIGWMNDLENMKVEDLKAWYQRWYQPNNATIVVVGDVTPKAVFKLAKKYFGPIKSQEFDRVKPQTESSQLGPRRITVKAPAKLPYLLMGFKAPVLKTAENDWEPYALEVLASVLDGGNSSRFAKTLIRDQKIASSVGAGYGLSSRIDDLFVFSGTPAQGFTIDDLEEAIKSQIKEIQDKPVSSKELSRIKAQVVASNVYERDSVFYQAMQIGILETVGLSWQLIDTYVKKIHQITPEQIQEVAKKYLIDDRLTVAVLDPQPLDAAKSRGRSHASGGRHGH